MTNALALDEPSELATTAQRCAATLVHVEGLRVDAPQALEYAGALLNSARGAWQALEAKRVHLKAPSLEAGRRVDEMFRPVLDPLKAAEGILKGKIAAYTLAARQAAQAALPAVAAGQAPLTALAPPEVPQGVTVREYWAWEVTCEAEVPRELMSVDAEKVKGAIWYADTPGQPPRPIPGLRWVRRSETRMAPTRRA